MSQRPFFASPQFPSPVSFNLSQLACSTDSHARIDARPIPKQTARQPCVRTLPDQAGWETKFFHRFDPALEGEWRLLKGSLSESGKFAAGMAFEVIAKAISRSPQAWIAVLFALHGAGLAPAGALGHSIPRQCPQ